MSFLINPYMFAAAPAGPTPFFWVSADSGVSTSGASKVYKWDDQSGKGNHLYTSGTTQPSFSANTFGTQPAVHFASNKIFSYALDKSYSTPLTMFYVMKINGNITTGGYGSVLDTTPGATRLAIWEYGWDASTDYLYLHGSSEFGKAYSIPNSGVFRFVFNGANSFVYKNGVYFSSGNTGTGAFSQFSIGAPPGGSPDLLNDDIAEVRMYEGALSSADISTIETTLRTKYGF